MFRPAVDEALYGFLIGLLLHPDGGRRRIVFQLLMTLYGVRLIMRRDLVRARHAESRSPVSIGYISAGWPAAANLSRRTAMQWPLAIGMSR